jgi:hypothetical protein
MQYCNTQAQIVLTRAGTVTQSSKTKLPDFQRIVRRSIAIHVEITRKTMMNMNTCQSLCMSFSCVGGGIENGSAPVASILSRASSASNAILMSCVCSLV